MKVVRIEKLPPGWTGKNHAMFAGSKAATGSWLLFTDADTTHEPESLATSVSCASEKKIDLLTLAPRTECRSFWEDLVQPIAVGSLAVWFDPVKVNEPKSGIVLANGQFILVKKEVYEKVGGNEAVKNEVVEDVELTKKVRAAGFSVQFLNGTQLYSTRMYSTLKEIRTGWTRIYTYLFNKKVLPILHKVFLFLFFSISPFILLATEVFLKIKASLYFDALLLWISLATCFFVVTVRFFGNKMLRTNPWFAFLHPLGSCVMVWILFSSIGRIVFNRPSKWRGDSYH
jgi:cellulose synthase/poly-beta-1,6-N-acetylglucosamine synthase-like glycosyltransferase